MGDLLRIYECLPRSGEESCQYGFQKVKNIWDKDKTNHPDGHCQPRRPNLKKCVLTEKGYHD